MEEIKQYLVPYILSNILFAGAIWAASRKPWLARVFLAAFFLWASLVNSRFALSSPAIYLDYARLAILPAYRNFINGFFSAHTMPLVLSIAICQFLIFVGLLLKGTWVRLSCGGGIIFGLAICPLGVGSAFPATFFMSMAFLLLLLKPGHDYIWKIRQYQKHHLLVD